MIGSYHRHHRKSLNDDFWEELRLTINEIKISNKHIIVCGGFNYNLLHHEHNEYVNEFVNMTYLNFL